MDACAPDPLRSVARAVAAGTVAVAGVVLAGWFSGATALTTFGSPISMKANAAVAFLLLGAALWRRATHRSGHDATTVLLAAAAAVLGGSTLLEHVVGIDLRIDELLVHEPSGMPATVAPGRFGPPASIGFVLTGLALAILPARRAATRIAVDAMLLATAVIGLLPLVGYGYRTSELYGVARLTGIAFHTAVTLEALALAGLLVAGDGGLVASLRGPGLGARLARRAVAYSTGLPLVVGWIVARGLGAGLYDGAFAVAVLVLALILMVTLLAWRDAVHVGRTEAMRDAALVAVRDASRRKDDFLSMLSHELRNPLAPIRYSVHVLEHADPTTQHAARARAVIRRQADHLTRLVDDLLDVTRIARGKIELRRARFDLLPVVSRTADDFRLVMEERGITLRTELCEAPLRVDGDATRITQIVGNLLHNAAKFSRRGDEVTLSVTSSDGAVEIRVRDTGAGIDPELLPHVFDVFTQGERTLARTEGGLGLGLALVKGIAELHGGSVHAESAGVGLGAQFVVRVPLSDSVTPAQGTLRPTSSGFWA